MSWFLTSIHSPLYLDEDTEVQKDGIACPKATQLGRDRARFRTQSVQRSFYLAYTSIGCLILAHLADLLWGPSWVYGQPLSQVVAGWPSLAFLPYLGIGSHWPTVVQALWFSSMWPLVLQQPSYGLFTQWSQDSKGNKRRQAPTSGMFLKVQA